ncbi:MAG TPA: carboxymuconolactone decarboxylase family protein [Alphaproteobacteria bacterium]|nr:carboxymuconolactone decarboxylase family protein [Alphaproteobacteria bacterium]HOO51250.1 carboxymuconolactone decarboxylase family protein [Alphaproteobacteria bacterium]
MAKDYQALTKDISQYMGELRKAVPDAMAGFSALAKGATQEGVLDKKTKELIALAIGVAARCDGCIGFHAKACLELGATREEIAETLALTIYMGGGPNLMYAADALRAYDQFVEAQK